MPNFKILSTSIAFAILLFVQSLLDRFRWLDFFNVASLRDLVCCDKIFEETSIVAQTLNQNLGGLLCDVYTIFFTRQYLDSFSLLLLFATPSIFGIRLIATSVSPLSIFMRRTDP